MMIRKGKTATSNTIAIAGLTALSVIFLSCSDINSSWEVDGGGYIKYKVEGKSYTIDLSRNDVEPPYYVNNSHSYFYFQTDINESSRGDQISLMVQSPVTAKKLTPVIGANINGSFQYVTWMKFANSAESPLVDDSTHKSYIHFDEIIKDSLYSADLNLYFEDCRDGGCNDSRAPILVTGRLRYWISPDDR